MPAFRRNILSPSLGLKVSILGSGGIFIGLEDGKAEGVDLPPLYINPTNSQHFHFSPEDGGSMFLRSVGIYRRVYTAPKSRTTSVSVVLSPCRLSCISVTMEFSGMWHFSLYALFYDYPFSIQRTDAC
jgi:hypothetical protein